MRTLHKELRAPRMLPCAARFLILGAGFLLFAAAWRDFDSAWLYRTAAQEIRVFPVGGDGWEFTDSWMAPRTYGGQRPHYGTDIMDGQNRAHRLTVLSMTDGKVVRMGWNERGGYRVGIVSQSGIYYYYAHLDAYAEGLRVGSFVHSGDMLGWMGSTGYGPERTQGLFPVHLHVGILDDPDGEGERWINPYPFLRNLSELKFIK